MKRLLLLPLNILLLIYQSIGLALVQIWANRTRSILTTLGIIIGVASVTSVIAALAGLKSQVLTEFERYGSNTIFAWPTQPDSGPLKKASWQMLQFRPDTFDGMLDHCTSLADYCRMSYGSSQTVRFGDREVANVRMSGIDSSWHRLRNRPITMGREFSVIDQQAARRVCIIAPDLRDELRLDRDCIGQSILIGNEQYRIVGVVEQRADSMFEGGGGQKQYNIQVPFKIFTKGQHPYINLMAAAKSTEQAEEAKAEIQFFLRKVRHIKPGEPDTFGVQTIQNEIERFNSMAGVITLVAGSVVSISLLVGGVGIMNIMLVSVSERTREIGLRKAVGAKKSAILMQFLVESVVLSLLGGLFGLLVGYAITSGIAKMSPMLSKTYIPFWAILLSFGFSAMVGVFFGMFPAIKAANLDPIDALRHE